MSLQDDILDGVTTASNELVIRPLQLGSDSVQNELLFFFKPECFLDTARSQQAEIVHTALNLFIRFGVESSGCIVVTGTELRERQIMDRHYGFINRVSRNASTVLSADELSFLRRDANVGAQTPILGGHEFLSQNPTFDEASLDKLWASKKSQKLRSGLYYESYTVDGKPVILVNGFHPAQLVHFTRDDRRIVLLVLRSDLPWKVLRSLMLGDTFPERAAVGSFRRLLYESPTRFGLSSVSIANNASHLSAGPFEALFELWNFFEKSSESCFELEKTRMWQLVKSAGVDAPAIRRSLVNPTSFIGAMEKTLFDATEDVDAMSAAHLYSQMFLEKPHLRNCSGNASDEKDHTLINL
jgi:hypothetical protein